MATNYNEWEGGSDFLNQLGANRAQLQEILSSSTPEQRQQMATGLSEYMAQLLERDPNAIPSGLSETLDEHRNGKGEGNKAVDLLRGVKNDFYNLFDKHPNVMLTTAGVIGAVGGLSLTKHYGKDEGSIGGILTSIGGLIFQGYQVVSMSTGPFKRRMDAEDHSISGEMAKLWEMPPEIQAQAAVPEGMDPNSQAGQMVEKSGNVFSRTFNEMVKHREMLIGNILVAGETFQTGGFVTSAYLDPKDIANQSPEVQHAKRRTAKFGLVNAVSNTLLMGLTYYNQYIDPELQELDKNSPTYKEDKKKVWDNAPSEHMFKPGRICAKALSKVPNSVKQKIPNAAILASYLPLSGMAMEGWNGGHVKPLQFYGSLAIMANVLIGYTSITNRSKGTKVLKPEELRGFAELIAETAQQSGYAQGLDPAAKAEEVQGLHQMIMSQSFVASEHEGQVQEILSQSFGLPFTAVRDHSKRMPISQEPVVLPSSHLMVQEISKTGAKSADLTSEGVSLQFDQLEPSTMMAITAINRLADQGSFTAKALGKIELQAGGEGKSGAVAKLPVQALPVLLEAEQAMQTLVDQGKPTQDQVDVAMQDVLKNAIPKAQILAQKQSAEQSAAR